MMKKLFNKIILMLCTIAVTASFTACSRIGYCDECGQRRVITEYVLKNGYIELVCNYCKGRLKIKKM